MALHGETPPHPFSSIFVFFFSFPPCITIANKKMQPKKLVHSLPKLFPLFSYLIFLFFSFSLLPFFLSSFRSTKVYNKKKSLCRLTNMPHTRSHIQTSLSPIHRKIMTKINQRYKFHAKKKLQFLFSSLVCALVKNSPRARSQSTCARCRPRTFP